MNTGLDLWIVRHAESLGNLDGSCGDTGLSELGRGQATRLAAALVGLSFDRVICSPLVRARETAGLAVPGRDLEIEPRLRELVTPRETFIDLARLGPEQLAELARTAEPEHETGKAFMARVRGWLAELPAEGRVLAFTHAGVVREALWALLPKSPRVQRIGFTAICRVRVTSRGNRVVALNDVGHLDEG
jgi:alpha-ribazole phosphatase